jgi:hypothetical protein
MVLRIEKAELPVGVRETLVRQVGKVAEPVEVLWNNPRLAEANQEFTAKAAGVRCLLR